MNKSGGNFLMKPFQFQFKKGTVDWLIIIVLVGANVVLKSLYINNYNIDLDEPFSIYHAQGSFRDLVKIFTWENNPPLFYIILHFWIKLFGIGSFSVRFLPMLFSSLAVIYVYKTGNTFISRLAAIIGSALYTCSNIVIMEAHDARIYSILVFLTVASMYNYFLLIHTKGQRKYLVGLTIMNVLLIYSHFLGFYVIFTQVIFLLFINVVRKRIFKSYFISSVILFLVYSPYLYFVVLRLTQAFKTGIYSPKTEIAHFLNLGWIFGNNILISIQFILIFIAFILFIYWKRVRTTLYEKMILSWPFTGLLIVTLLSFKISILPIPKYLIFLIPGIFLSFSVAIKYFYRYSNILGTSIIIFSLSVMIMTIEPKSSQGFEIKKALEVIQYKKSDSTVVFILPEYIALAFTYHYNIDAFKDFGHYRKYLNDDHIYVLDSAEIADFTIPGKASDVLLLVGWKPLLVYDPENRIYNELNKNFRNSAMIASFHGYTVYHFTK